MTFTTEPVSLLILGAGWTSTFLLPLLESHKISHVATTRSGTPAGTIPFTYDPDSSDLAPYRTLPDCETMLISFPLKDRAQARLLLDCYVQTHPNVAETVRIIQLGSIGLWRDVKGWVDEHSPWGKTNERGLAEDELLLRLGQRGAILNLGGLWGGERQPKMWVSRVAKTKAEVKSKGCIHLVHGEDVAKAIVCCVQDGDAARGRGFRKLGGQRWIVTNVNIYDWWDFFVRWGKETRERLIKEGVEGAEGFLYEDWVAQLMKEEGIEELPRSLDRFERKVNGSAFWRTVDTLPDRKDVYPHLID